MLCAMFSSGCRLRATPSCSACWSCYCSIFSWDESCARTEQGTKPGIEWLKPGLIARVRYIKGEAKLRHATLAGSRRVVTLKITWRRTVIAGETRPEDFIAARSTVRGTTIAAQAG